MDGTLPLVAHLLNGLLMVALPLALAGWLARRVGLSWRLVSIGGATFLLAQALHIPANAGLGWLINSGTLPLPAEPWRSPLLAAIAGLSAGIFEEGARYAAYRWWARDARSWSRALLLGAGHGGAESVLLGLLALLSFFGMVSMRGVDLAGVVPAGQLEAAQAQVAAYWGMPWYGALLGALERALSLPVQIGLSVLVLQAFTRRQIGWLFVAVVWHAAIDAVIAGYLGPLWLGKYEWGAYALEGVVAAIAVVSVAVVFLLRRSAAGDAAPGAVGAGSAPALPPAPARPAPLPETEETLEETRYRD